jgi:hypothetical protein
VWSGGNSAPPVFRQTRQCVHRAAFLQCSHPRNCCTPAALPASECQVTDPIDANLSPQPLAARFGGSARPLGAQLRGTPSVRGLLGRRIWCLGEDVNHHRHHQREGEAQARHLGPTASNMAPRNAVVRVLLFLTEKVHLQNLLNSFGYGLDLAVVGKYSCCPWAHAQASGCRCRSCGYEFSPCTGGPP